MKFKGIILSLFLPMFCFGQNIEIKGIIKSNNSFFVPFAQVQLVGTTLGTQADSLGHFSLFVHPGKYTIAVNRAGYFNFRKQIVAKSDLQIILNLEEKISHLDEVVITASVHETNRKESITPIHSYNSSYFKQIPNENLFEGLKMVNGVRSQSVCNVCNTGELRINGMEGPYTLVLIDGMPIVSGIGSIYGYMGIPFSMIEKIEVVKGPTGSFYGSEAMAGVINIITKKIKKDPELVLENSISTLGENQTDVGSIFKINKHTLLSGINTNYFNQKLDINNDGFTDVALTKRLSFFAKIGSANGSFGIRYLTENRWGGQLNWDKSLKGSDSIYAEYILTNRAEVLLNQRIKPSLKLLGSWVYHQQDSWYGNAAFLAKQQTGFLQLQLDSTFNKIWRYSLGSAFKWNIYDDNTFLTESDNFANKPIATYQPGLFAQIENTANSKLGYVGGFRIDYFPEFGIIPSPRLGFKYKPNDHHIIKGNLGRGFRVVNLFTEDHSAINGSRKVEIKEKLNPESSLNATLNYLTDLHFKTLTLDLEVGAFISHFTNKIIPDFDTDPEKIIYHNLSGYSQTRGINFDVKTISELPWQIKAGITYTDAFRIDKINDLSQKSRLIYAPKFSGNVLFTYTFTELISLSTNLNYTGKMRLPVFKNDFRPDYSPDYVLVDLNLNWKISDKITIGIGGKNMFNFLPTNPLMRPFDPFDKKANDPVSNPNGYTFDTTYAYAPLLKRRMIFQLKWNIL